MDAAFALCVIGKCSFLWCNYFRPFTQRHLSFLLSHCLLDWYFFVHDFHRSHFIKLVVKWCSNNEMCINRNYFVRVYIKIHFQIKRCILCTRHHTIIRNIKQQNRSSRYVRVNTCVMAWLLSHIHTIQCLSSLPMTKCLTDLHLCHTGIWWFDLHVTMCWCSPFSVRVLDFWTHWRNINNVSNRIIFLGDVLHSEVSLKFDYLRVQMSHCIKIQYRPRAQQYRNRVNQRMRQICACHTETHRDVHTHTQEQRLV